MATAPPLARDRLIGLAYVSPNLVKSMEGQANRPPRLPPRTPPEQLDEELGRICAVLTELIDIDIFAWPGTDGDPAEEEVKRAASVLADRLCGATSDPIIRNAQEERQLSALRSWFEANEYHNVYLNLHPKPALQKAMRQDSRLAIQLLDPLNRIDPQTLVSCGRTYGGNLHKLEPKELATVPLHGLPQRLKRSQPMQYPFPIE